MAVLHGLDQALQLVGVPDDDGLRVSPASYSATVAMIERLYAPCPLSLMGLRPAEVCVLRWSDVDFAVGTIAAGENTRTLVDGEIEEKEAKSAAGKRGLPMSATVAKALKAFQTLQKKERLKVGDAYVDMGYVLVDELGQPQRTDWLRRRCTS